MTPTDDSDAELARLATEWTTGRVRRAWTRLAAVLFALAIVVAILAWTVFRSFPARMLVFVPLLLAALPLAILSRKRALAWGLVAGPLVLLGVALLLRPARMPPEGSGWTVWDDRASFFDVIPESDQVRAGLALFPIVDPYFDASEARNLAPLLEPIYREIDGDPAQSSLGSVLGDGYRELLGESPVPGRILAWTPPAQAGQGFPAIVFLHGSAGGFAFYGWFWRQLAARAGFAVVLPTFGFGNWRRDGGLEAVRRGVQAARALPGVDPQRIVLVGLSNGGLGAGLGGASIDGLAGLAFISPVIDDALIETEAFRSRWQGKPVFVSWGEEDERIATAFTHHSSATLRAAGVDVTTAVHPTANHFMLLGERPWFEAAFLAWLQAARLLPTPEGGPYITGISLIF